MPSFVIEDARPNLPASPRPYGLLPAGDSPISESIPEKTRKSAMPLALCVLATIAVLLCLIAAYIAFVFPRSAEKEEVALELEVKQLGDIDDFRYEPETIEEPLELSLPEDIEFALSPAAFNEIEDTGELFTFSLTEDDVLPVLSISASLDIEEAIDAIKENGDSVSCLFVDVKSGRGYAYTIDEDIYGASSFKAPLASYILSHIADTEGVSSNTMSQIEASVEWSDNDAFVSLSGRYRHTDEFDSWLSDELDIDDSDGVLFSIGDYAKYSARDAAKMWTFMSDYLDSGTDGAVSLAQFCSNTNMSFIRDGINEVLDGVVEYKIDDDGAGQIALAIAPPESVIVYNKAGWYPDSGICSSTTDNALIEVDGRRYVMCILTSLPYSERNASKVSQLAGSLFSARGCLVVGEEASRVDDADEYVELVEISVTDAE